MAALEAQTKDNTPPAVVKPRLTWVAFLFSLACPGLGHIYAARLKDGYFYLFLQFIFLAISSGIQFFSPPIAENVRTILLLLMANLILRLIAAINVSVRVFNSEPARMTSLNKVSVYAAIFLFTTMLYAIPNHMGVSSWEHYAVQEKGMCPTLNEGDEVIVWENYFRERSPQAGDVVLFRQKNGQKRVKRIVGMPGQTIQLVEGRLLIDGKQIERLTVGASYSMPEGVGNQFVEALSSDCRYTITQTDDKGPASNTTPIVVPEDSYFLLGDNRPVATDSRQFGPVPKSALLGKVSAYFWSSDRNRIGQQVE